MGRSNKRKRGKRGGKKPPPEEPPPEEPKQPKPAKIKYTKEELKGTKYAPDNASGYSHCPKEKQSPSSTRVHVANKIMDTELNQGAPPNTNKALRSLKKDVKISKYVRIEPKNSDKVKLEDCEGKTYSSNPEQEGLELIDPAASGYETMIHYHDEDNQVFSCIYVSRNQTLEQMQTNMTTVCQALNKAQETEPNCNRSANKTGTSATKAKYITIGSRVQRGRPGFSHDKLRYAEEKAFKTIEKLVRRLEHHAASVVSSALLRAISTACDAKCWHPEFEDTKMAQALAHAKDYSAPAHRDKDFLFSLHQLNVNFHHTKLNDEIAQWFCFPEYNYAIALRPGDLLLFNPLVCHCLSEKTPAYEDKEVHVTTLYLKTGHVDGNDNTRNVSKEKMAFLKSKGVDKLECLRNLKESNNMPAVDETESDSEEVEGFYLKENERELEENELCYFLRSCSGASLKLEPFEAGRVLEE